MSPEILKIYPYIEHSRVIKLLWIITASRAKRYAGKMAKQGRAGYTLCKVNRGID